jgi:hypothetical protein
VTGAQGFFSVVVVVDVVDVVAGTGVVVVVVVDEVVVGSAGFGWSPPQATPTDETAVRIARPMSLFMMVASKQRLSAQNSSRSSESGA